MITLDEKTFGALIRLVKWDGEGSLLDAIERRIVEGRNWTSRALAAEEERDSRGRILTELTVMLAKARHLIGLPANTIDIDLVKSVRHLLTDLNNWIARARDVEEWREKQATSPSIDIDTFVDRMMSWPLPDTVNPDGEYPAGKYREKFGHPLTGTNLFGAEEARQLYGWLFAPKRDEVKP